MLDLLTFRQDLLNQAYARASLDGIFTSDAFTVEAAELLIDAQEVDSLDVLSFTGTGRRRQSLAVHGFQHDIQDGSITLAVSHFLGGSEIPTITRTDVTTRLKALEQFLEEALSGDFLVDREPSSQEYQLAQTLAALSERSGDSAVTRYKLYFLTDARLRARAGPVRSAEIGGTAADFHIWDIQRFYQVHQSAQGREPLKLDLENWGTDGVPALMAEDSAGDITTYLAAVPGELLASLYRQHGSRLLEGNVRSFLTTRGKINKGIRQTLVTEPAHFLAYNNGISATASRVDYSNGRIRSITDLQIVNGGQTTASLFYATQGNRNVARDVFVQMKLVVVSAERAQIMVPLISRYANSQNAVREDDFFSNSPFHIRLEELSKRLLAPAKPGSNYQTKWYYERTRGQYFNERNRRSAAEGRKFEAEYPRLQVITKTDAAKYVVSWEQQPHQVSSGAQKNFKAFASLVSAKFAEQPEAFSENYYRRLVAKAILFNAVRSSISKADWYESGYLANLTTYAVAKLSLEISRDQRAKSFDLLRIWEAQAVSLPTLVEAVMIARHAHALLTAPDRPVVNVTEWAKRESAWKKFAALPLAFSDAFLLDCIPPKLNYRGDIQATVRSQFQPDIPDWQHVRDVEPAAWASIQRFLGASSRLTSSEASLLRVHLSGTRRIDADGARGLLQLYVKALNHGWMSSTTPQ